MQTAVEKLEGLERRLTVNIAKEQVNDAFQKRLQEVAKTANIRGFRPGKVPANVLEKQYGKSICSDVAGELMNESFEPALKEHDMEIAGQPSIEPTELKKDEEFSYVATFEVYPEVTLKDFSEMEIEEPTCELQDEDCAKMLENIQKQHAQWTDVERACQNGDRVNIDFEGFIDDKPFDGGKAEGFDLELGAKQMIAGFEDGIVGMSVGDERDMSVSFPEEYPVQDLAGKPAIFKIKLHKVSESKLPEADDALAEKVGVEGGIEGLKAEIRKNMERELASQLKSKRKAAVLDTLVDSHPMDVPGAMLEGEIKHLQNMTKQQMAMQAGKREMPDMELPRDPYIDQAKRRVMLGLVLGEIIKANELKADEAQVRQHVEEIAASYEDSQEVIDWYMNNERMRSEIEAVVLEDQAVQKVLDSAKITKKSSSYDEIVNSGQK